MAIEISPLADVHPDAEIGAGSRIGPFCVVGPRVRLGRDCRLLSHVVIHGDCVVGDDNRFWPTCVIGGEPQDKSWSGGGETGVVIGDGNQFREGVTVNRGAEKEDGTTRIGHRNLLMANAHVAHNCVVHDDCLLVNGTLLGGHVHVHDRAILGGATAVHHWVTVGRGAFTAGSARIVRDLPPFMLAAGTDDPGVKSINAVGMRRAGAPEAAVRAVRQCYKLLFRDGKSVADARAVLPSRLTEPGPIPAEADEVLRFVEEHSGSRNGRGREGRVRTVPALKLAPVPVRRAA